VANRPKSKSKPKSRKSASPKLALSKAELAQLRRCETLVKDQAEAGLRADLNPTLSYAVGPGEDEASAVARAHREYLAALDRSARERAAAALVG
jgi:hypothetical protein